ncbi:MAG: hypothetical protein HQ445_02575 [Polaromonas sp.]|nr:hypothetical protein [Polaromonas sp.]
MTKPPVLPSVVIPRALLCKQALEISDVAREHRDFESALAALDFIAQLQGMYDDPGV